MGFFHTICAGRAAVSGRPEPTVLGTPLFPPITVAVLFVFRYGFHRLGLCRVESGRKAEEMRRRVFLVHDDADFRAQAAAALAQSGYDVSTCTDSIAALAALESNPAVDLLFTRADFGRDKLHGIALARMVGVKYPAIKVLICGKPDYAAEATGAGTFVPAPLTMEQLVKVADSLLKPA
jgi:CheY-like chemotaxis protein